MINIRELKLGNIIQEQGLPYLRLSPFIFREILDKPYLIKGLKSKEPRFKPMPLSNEWMVKLGFSENKDGQWLNHRGLSLWFRLDLRDNVPDLTIWNYTSLFSIRQLQYVHELQNVYFSLTGEELKLT
jgi:hypothetical protein